MVYQNKKFDKIDLEIISNFNSMLWIVLGVDVKRVCSILLKMGDTKLLHSYLCCEFSWLISMNGK